MRCTDYCPECVSRIEEHLGGNTLATFALPCDVRFDPCHSRVVRTAIWHAGDHIELLHWTDQTPCHMVVSNPRRKRQSRVRLCEPALRWALRRIRGSVSVT